MIDVSKAPSRPGWYWARWISKAPGTSDPNEGTSGDWEIVDVFENCIDKDHPEHLAVFVSGVATVQYLGNFEWGDRLPGQKPGASDKDVHPRYRHKKRGSTYQVIGRGRLQGEPGALTDMANVVIYRAESDGSIWVRPENEFNDGRFETIAPDPGATT